MAATVVSALGDPVDPTHPVEPVTGPAPHDLDPLEHALLDGIVAAPASGGIDAGHGDLLTELFEAQVRSRLVDHAARWLRTEHGLGYYTIGSAGHESNAAVALALRVDDPALLHYRSGGFVLARSARAASEGRAVSDPVDDTLRGMLARSTEPIAGGRHKVWGSADLSIVPMTSTIGSHPPRAVGLARAIGMSDRTELDADGLRWPADAVVVSSFGDASLNHSTTQGALHWAALAAHRGEPCPVLFLCEDNGLGISVRTPHGWVADVLGRSGLDVASADGTDPLGVWSAASDLVESIRHTGRPGILHLRTVRFLGHAGSDAEAAYRTPTEIRSDHDQDPLLATARSLVGGGVCGAEDLVAWYLDERRAIRDRALELTAEPPLTSAEQIVAPLAPRRPDLVASEVASTSSTSAPTDDGSGLTLAQTINRSLRRALDDPHTLVFGEDVGRKGGVYGVTRGLQRAVGVDQVFDTHLDESSILGLALGASLQGFLPIPEIQYLAYLHNAEDQLRGEAASLRFFSQGAYTNPMVVRIAGYAYQKGFGGHFHNDHSIAVLRDLPGVVIASPAHPADAGAMFDTCVASARIDGSVCVFLEPIARYHTADLYTDGDGGWLQTPGATDPHVPIGRARTWGDGADGTILTWGNGLFLSLRAARRIERERGERWRVVDLRWLAPLPIDDMVREAEATGRVLVVDETRHSGGVGEAVVTALVEADADTAIRRISAIDTFIPLGAAADLVLVSEDQIVQATRP